jgi:ribosome-associated translation inhibitor RaiA
METDRSRREEGTRPRGTVTSPGEQYMETIIIGNHPHHNIYVKDAVKKRLRVIERVFPEFTVGHVIMDLHKDLETVHIFLMNEDETLEALADGNALLETIDIAFRTIWSKLQARAVKEEPAMEAVLSLT